MKQAKDVSVSFEWLKGTEGKTANISFAAEGEDLIVFRGAIIGPDGLTWWERRIEELERGA